MRNMKTTVKLLASSLMLVPFITASALAEGAEVAAATGSNGLGAGLGIALAATGGAYAQSKVISSALESISRNPGAAGQMFLPWILGVVAVESLVIFALLIALKLAAFI